MPTYATPARDQSPDAAPDGRDVRRASLGGLLAYPATGCPVCHKVVRLNRQEMCGVPQAAADHDIADGVSMEFVRCEMSVADL